MSAKKEIAKTGDLFGGLPAERPEYISDTAMRGNEGVSMDDMTIPRLQIIQDLSPQHKKSKPEYIEGAEPGMCFNTATLQLYGKSVYLVPVIFRKEWVLWRELDAGGGFGGAYGSAADAEAERLQQDTPDQWEVQDTAQQFCLMVHPESTAELPVTEEIVISMSKSQLKPSRQWNTMIRSAGGDRFSRMYKLSVVEMQNKANQDYQNWKLDPVGYVPELVYKAAESMYESVSAGLRDVSRKTESAQADTSVEVGEEF